VQSRDYAAESLDAAEKSDFGREIEPIREAAARRAPRERRETDPAATGRRARGIETG
jgi:hypothetical protein